MDQLTNATIRTLYRIGKENANQNNVDVAACIVACIREIQRVKSSTDGIDLKMAA